MVGEAPAPLELEMYLLATGERGIGFPAVFGAAPLTLVQFRLLSYLQRRVLQASTEEGRKDLAQEVAIRAAIEAERESEREKARILAAAANAGAGKQPAPRVLLAQEPSARPTTPPPFDPAVMTEDEVRLWIARYGRPGLVA